MISSRWPRPESWIDRQMPVCTGVSTTFARNHAGRDALDRTVLGGVDRTLAVSQLAAIMRYGNASPTGTSMMRPVLFTMSPSSMSGNP